MAGVGNMKPIQVRQLQSERDSNGFDIAGDRLVFTGWASVRQASGFREYLTGQAQLGTIKEFRIRHTHGFPYDVDTRLVYDGKQYTINSMERDREKRFWWVIRATALDQGERSIVT